jgi:hypothetical protein
MDVDGLFNLAIQVCGFDIKLLGAETIRSNDRQEMVQGIEMYNRGKCLIVILSLNVEKSFCY